MLSQQWCLYDNIYKAHAVLNMFSNFTEHIFYISPLKKKKKQGESKGKRDERMKNGKEKKRGRKLDRGEVGRETVQLVPT